MTRTRRALLLRQVDVGADIANGRGSLALLAARGISPVTMEAVSRNSAASNAVPPHRLDSTEEMAEARRHTPSKPSLLAKPKRVRGVVASQFCPEATQRFERTVIQHRFAPGNEGVWMNVGHQDCASKLHTEEPALFRPDQKRRNQ